MTIPEELASGFCARPVDAHKRSVGTVSIIGGSAAYPHAPVIAALGARAAGAGLVQLVVPAASHCAAAVMVPEATFTDLSPTCVPPRADVTVVGMGLGVSLDTDLLLSRILSGSTGRFVVDADALNVLAGWYATKRGRKAPFAGRDVVLTPHEGEAGRLVGWPFEKVRAARSEAAREIAVRYGATVVLKGAGTLVVSADGSRVYRNTTGNPCMALGGMGDLLAGVIGARWAYLKGDAFTAVASSVWLHGAAGDRIAAESRDPSIVNTAAEIGGLRVRLDR